VVSDAAPHRCSLDLPAWPVYVLLVGFPVWWALGLSAFAPALSAVPMVVLLSVRGRVEVPRSFALWGGFLVFATTAVVMIDGPLRVIGFGVRWLNYLGATVLFLYVYNCSHRSLPRRSALLAVAFFFAFVVVGGYLGLLLPDARLRTPMQSLLPAVLLDNDYVRALVSPALAEVQRPYGSPRSFTRPSAPFAYTNGWGCNTALLVPFTIAALTQVRSALRRTALVLVLAAAAVPAAGTLNRGLYIALLAGFAYATFRLALRRRIVAVTSLALGFGVVAVVAVVSGLTGSLTERLYYSTTNLGRSTIYREALDGALESPLLGHGAPRPSALLDISIGTQGQVWNIMFSYGFPALVLFVGWFLAALWSTRRPRDDAGLWLHVVLAVVLLTIVYYGYDGPQLSVAMLAAALGMRPHEAARSSPVASLPATSPATASDRVLQQ
jgi:hypothetical protein